MTGLPATTTYHKTSSPAVATHTPPGKARAKITKTKDADEDAAKARAKVRAKAKAVPSRNTTTSSNLPSAHVFMNAKRTLSESPSYQTIARIP